MPPRNPVQPQVPGEVVVQDETIQPEGDQPGPVAEEQVTISKADLEALMARVNALESHPKAKRVAAKSASLPDQADIDPTKIKSPVLAAQGWVVPESYGANPAAPKVG